MILYCILLILQIGEGFVWLALDYANPGTALKLSSVVTSTIFLLMVYVILEKVGFKSNNTVLKMIGDYSWGIYLSHVFVLYLLKRIPYYESIPFVVNSAIVLLISFGLCYIGEKILSKKISSWFGFK